MKKVIFYFILIYLFGCSSKFPISKYTAYGYMKSEWYNTYYNDSLKFLIDLYGKHELDSIHSRKIFIPKTIRKLLAEYDIKKAELLLKYKSTYKKEGNDCYGFILPKVNTVIDSLKYNFIKDSSNNSSFFYSKKIFTDKGKIKVITGFALQNNVLFFVYSWNRGDDFAEDSSLLAINAIKEMKSLKKQPAYQFYISKRKELLDSIQSFIDNKDYLKSTDFLKAIPVDTIYNYHLEDYYYQMLITKVSFLDNLDETKKYASQYRTDYSSKRDSIVAAQKLYNAKNIIFKIAQTQKILMFNESHYDYRNRFFVYLLLDSLYKMGYRNLCIEDRVNDSISSTKYPDTQDGTYIAEPFMAGLVRKAQQSGFKIYGYDTSASDIDDREKFLAQNLYKLYKKDTANKWIVYGGYNHINKVSFDDSHKSMYQYFTQLAGFQPYSINQSNFSDINHYSFSFKEDSVGYFAFYGNSDDKNINQSDLYIVNNIEQHPFEKPFPEIKSLLKEYDFKTPFASLRKKYIFVYVKDEFNNLKSDAIPFYIGKISSDITKLFLPENAY